jgi:hypothetical protein
MAAPHDDHVEVLGGLGAEGHRSILDGDAIGHGGQWG